MRSIKIWSLLSLIVLLSIPVYAAKKTHALPANLSGSMMPYDFTLTDSVPIWPDSLKPVYVARVARHGARYISSPKKLAELKEVIAKAAENGNLSNDGRKFSLLLKKVEDSTGDQWGRLSDVGCKEEQLLATNLYCLLPELMKSARINAISSYIPRVVMTMYQFSHQLSALSSGISISTSEGEHFSYLLRCFSVDSNYADYRENGNWVRVSEHLADSIVSPEPARRLFGTKCTLSEKELKALTLKIYDILQSLTAFGMDAPTDEFMSEQEYRACWEVSNLEHYLRNSITPISSLAGKATSPLLARIITDADAALDRNLLLTTLKRADMDSQLAPEGYDANFYFGHAETLMPLLSLMRVPGCFDDSDDFYKLSNRWQDYNVVPLGANIDLIFLADKNHNIYVALRHNGHFVAPMSAGMIVPWTDYKSYLTNLMLKVSEI